LKTLFSIVVPVYNRAQLVPKAIASVLSQSLSHFELILVDDASTDNTVQVINTIDDPRIKLISLTENGGNAKARNMGWKAAKGDWIVYLDSDDWLELDYLSTLQVWIDNNPIESFFWTGVRYIHESTKTTNEGYWTPRGSLPGDTFFDELRIGTGFGLAVKKDILIECNGFDESFRAAVDREFFLRISRSVSGRVIPIVLVNLLVGEHSSVRKDFNAQYKAYSKMVKLYSSEIEATASRKKWWYHKSMWLALYCHDFKQARYFLKLNGYSIKSVLLYSIFSLFPLKVAKDLHKKLA
jgi:glycosyltransferase involved in cell wall biosynthesis